MRPYTSLDQMWHNTVRSLLISSSQTSRDGDTQEIIGYSATLLDPSRSWLRNARRNASPHYAAAEMLWYAGGTDDVSMIAAYAPSYMNYAESNGKAYGAYGERTKGAIEEVVRAFKQRPDSRRVVVGLWRPFDITAGHGVPDPFDEGDFEEAPVKDVPCTLTWQFLLRGDVLHMVVNMRSQDVWKGMPYDVFCNCIVQRVVANQLGVNVGHYIHNVGSMHLYDRNRIAAAEAVELAIEPCAQLWQGATDCYHNLRAAASAEWCMRTGNIEQSDGRRKLPTISRTLLSLCQAQLKDVSMLPDCDPVMYEAYRQFKGL